MKKILIIFVIIFLVLITGCKSKDFTISIQEDEFLSLFYDYENTYKSDENGIVELPLIEDGIFFEEQILLEEDKTICKLIQYKINFDEWVDEDNKKIDGQIIKKGKDQTIKAIYYVDKTEKIINLYCNNLELTSSNEINNIYVLPTVNNQNFEFKGWYYNELCLGKDVVELDFSSLSNETSLYAKLIPSASYVNTLIEQLPDELTVFDIKNIETLNELYKELSYESKKEITNYEKLESAYNQIDDLKEAYELYVQLTELYDKDITADLKKELEMLIELLETCEEEIKALIPNLDYDKLDDILNKVNILYEKFAKDALEFDKKIAQIPSFLEKYYIEEIKTLYLEYETLDENILNLLNATTKLETLYTNALSLEQSSDVIFYLNTENTNNIYTSKNELFTAFFTDFYYYIVAYHDDVYLKKNKIKNVDDFVKLAGDFYGANASNLYGIGNLAGRYMLEKDINGILENQTDNAFFGFCYQNGLYTDVLPFFINFFAYWRIDEKYANTSNYGADIFAESWAPTVDIAKFFYYDENTSYVKTERMIDCLTNTASVVYNFDGTLTKNLKLRGYIFEGWYDNPEFNGQPLTNFSSSTKKVYAKWSADQNQIDADAANLVDVYIYNLTTSKAVVNATTVGYVKNMYDKLTQKGKQLVKNKTTLDKLIDRYL